MLRFNPPQNTAAKMIAYYTKPRELECLRSKTSGEVPDKFRTFPIELSVECFHLPWNDPLRARTYRAKVEIWDTASECYHPLFTTEDIDRESCPSFVRRGLLPALSMTNSQCMASSARLRVTVYARSRRIGDSQFRIADILWNDLQIQALNLQKRERPYVKANQSRISAIMVKVDAYPPDDHSSGIYFFDCSVSQALLRRLVGGKVFFVVLRSASKGQWIPLFRSEVVARSRADVQRFKKAGIALNELLAYQSNRQIRIQLCGMGRNHHPVIGFSQLELPDLYERADAHRRLPWSHGTLARVQAGLLWQEYKESKLNFLVKLKFVCCSELPVDGPEVVDLGPFRDRERPGASSSRDEQEHLLGSRLS